MRNNKALWDDLPTNMMVSITIKTQDRDMDTGGECYLSLRLRKTEQGKRTYKEFSSLNEDNWHSHIKKGVKWLIANGNRVEPFEPPPWKEVLKRLNIKQTVKTVKKFQYTDKREYAP